MENYGIFLLNMIEIVAKGDTFIINFQFSILNYLSSELLDKLEVCSIKIGVPGWGRLFLISSSRSCCRNRSGCRNRRC